MYLGIHNSNGMVFEGDGTYAAHLVWPIPLLTPAKLFSVNEQNIRPDAFDLIGIAKMLFREDSFDPVTRIRRGRFYKQYGEQPSAWTVMMTPPFSATVMPEGQRAYTFQSCFGVDMPTVSEGGQKLVVLGADDAFSVWTIINKELVHSREILVTLKARQSLGTLPEIDWSKVFDEDGLVKATIDSLLDDIYRAGSESVIDRVREAITAILSSYLQQQGEQKAKGQDLANLISLLVDRNGKNEQRIVASAAEISRVLHSRVKTAVRGKLKEIRPVREQDAELAVQCVGVILCDLGWAVWR